jgi:hypothetical protein
VIVHVSEDWLVFTLFVVSVFEFVDEPTPPLDESVQLIDVARVASLPPGRSARDSNVTVARDSGALPKSLEPAVPPEVTTTDA